MYFIRVGKGYFPEYPCAFAAIKNIPEILLNIPSTQFDNNMPYKYNILIITRIISQ